ncbi:hypothetical protein AB3S75_031514 [Citrus x aurantiifolia]
MVRITKMFNVLVNLFLLVLASNAQEHNSNDEDIFKQPQVRDQGERGVSKVVTAGLGLIGNALLSPHAAPLVNATVNYATCKLYNNCTGTPESESEPDPDAESESESESETESESESEPDNL